MENNTQIPAAPAQQLNTEQIDALIRHWSAKSTMPRVSPVQKAIAEGHVSAFQTVRIVHGLPMLEVA